MIEGRGNDRGQIGMACMDLRHSELNLCQFVDTSSYILLKVCLSIHEPVEERISLVDFIRNFVWRESVTSIQRRFFNDSRGIDLVKQLGVQESSNVDASVLPNTCYSQDALGVEHPTVGRLLGRFEEDSAHT
uniref:Uncharacterized protein n=1 Tax=Ditylenchus dipsaci TaxID=166011 RepID=A0A915DYB5_9BILA